MNSSDPATRSDWASAFSTRAANVVVNAGVPALLDFAVRRGEGTHVNDGPLLVSTVPHTGRSAKAKRIVRDPAIADSIWWDGNRAMAPAEFSALATDMLTHARGRELFVQDRDACAHPEFRLGCRIVTETAWHSLFARHLLREPEEGDRSRFDPAFTIVDFPSFRASPDRHGAESGTVIAISFAERLVLICGTAYAGEIKKAVFTILNHVLPERGVMPMHCAANHARGDPESSAVFFGLSGTGKTTLSTSGDRELLGDDEHGWADGGLFNFEGGCYAKTYGLSEAREPEIYRAALGVGSVIENVALDRGSGEPDFTDSSITENGRCAYPLNAITGASRSAFVAEPGHVVMLACDAFSVLPPLARLTPEQAVYHFLSGFTAKLAGTEQGQTEPAPTFSACFGAPFLPRPPALYGKLFGECLARRSPACWLVNTGWSGGPPGEGERYPLAVTRALLASALDGRLDSAPMRKDPNFGFAVPCEAPGVDSELLVPATRWRDPADHARAARLLVGRFRENFQRYAQVVSEEIRAAAPAAD